VYVNIPNGGWIANLEQGGVVEVEGSRCRRGCSIR
jgi:hypothetical protein